jgi:N-acetylmuramic acid 6-phosphate etherase
MKYILAFEGGGTKTSAGLYDSTGKLLREAEGGPSNPVAYGTDTCLRVISQLGRQLLPEDAGDVVAAAGIAGAVGMPLRQELARRLCAMLSLSRAVVTADLHPVLFANVRGSGGILAIAGTGATVLGQSPDGQYAQAGGRGIVFGDEGSAYQIAVTALRHAAYAVDGMGPETALAQALYEVAGLADFAALTPWSCAVSKQEIAALAQAVNRCADEGDEIARMCLEDQARRLAQHVLAVQRRLDLDESDPVFLVGGLFEKSSIYRAAFESALDAFTGMRAQVPRIRGHAASVPLAQSQECLPWLAVAVREEARSVSGLPPTEQRQRGEKTLDQMSFEEIFDTMNNADRHIAEAVAAQRAPIVQAIGWAAEALRAGGRIFYLGSGTSGRLGVLDASECPPTFGVPPERVVGIIAGGEAAIRTGVEGSEDDRDQAATDIAGLAPEPRDLVVGIAASGTTPYTRAALEAAAARGARTVLLCCNPAVADGAACVIAVDTGPEAISGSTRLKAGTACKMVLNMISTGAFAKSGYVLQGLMIKMRPVNAKLRDRAVRIVSEISGVDPADARTFLEQADWDITKALERTKA